MLLLLWWPVGKYLQKFSLSAFPVIWPVFLHYQIIQSRVCCAHFSINFKKSLDFEKHFSSMFCKLRHNKFKILKCILHLKCILKIHIYCIWNSLNLKSTLCLVFKTNVFYIENDFSVHFAQLCLYNQMETHSIE